MILYLDASALLKRYVVEDGTVDVIGWINQSRLCSTSIITRAEMGAAITKAARLSWISADQGLYALQWFRSEWETFARLPVTEATVQRADELACQYGLRGYDAVHLASAILFQAGSGAVVTLATYNLLLWQAGKAEGLAMLPFTNRSG